MMKLKIFLVLNTAVLLAACVSNPVSETARSQGEALAEQQRSAITEPGRLSVHSLLVYRMLDLEELAQDDPAAALAALDADENETISETQRSLAAAETSYLLADAAPDLDEARKHFARAVVTAIGGLRGVASLSSILDPRHRLLGEIYNRGLARFIVISQAVEGHPRKWRGVGGDHPMRVTFENVPASIDLALFDEFIVCDESKFEGIPNRHLRPGVGVPLIGVRDNTQGQGRKDPLRAARIAEPVTAIARLTDDGGLAFSFVDPRRVNALPARDGRELTIAADFSSPLSWLVATSPLYTEENPSLFDPESFEHMAGLYFAEPYDPKKIPVLMTHGLWSSPLTWIWLVNEVWGDPMLRERYQVWYYAYPTGLPILHNAGNFQTRLHEAIAKVDPEGDDAVSRDLILIGHSMGGLLSKHLVKEIGNSLWDTRCTKPFSEVRGSPEDLALLKAAFFYSPLPQVHEVIFMATPHRGSSLAEGFIGAIGDAMITLPKGIEDAVARLVADNPGLLRVDPRMDDGPMTSIRNLRSDSPLLAALDEAPWKAGLTVHSIIGDVEGAGRTGGTDSVVPYVSSHQDSAVSELVVHNDHSLTGNPSAMAEVRRILREHLRMRP